MTKRGASCWRTTEFGTCFFFFLALILFPLLPRAWSQSTSSAVINIDGNAPVHPFPHFWETMFGSGRAVLSLRDSYRRDLRETHDITGFQYVRFHAIFHDELGVYDEDAQGRPIYNFSYVDQVYDGLLANGVKPFVELSFMPYKLASKPALHAFWYKQNVAPPKDWGKWDDLITAFTRHLVNRYGVNEVATWYFEVWNEPNIDFWVGDPKQPTYWDLYDHTARDVKSVNARLRVGGPSTAQAAWVDALIRHAADNKVPLDFVSTHVYGNDKAEDVFGAHEVIPRDKMVCRAVGKVHDQIKASAMPKLPLIWSEFNASYKNEPEVTDSVYMGPWLADTIRQCDGLVDIMSYWTFSDVFEEQGIVRTPFYGGFGLIAAGDILKPSFEAFKLLHKLGNTRLDLTSDSALATRQDDGSLVVAVWNYAAPEETGAPRSVTLHFSHVNAQQVQIWRVDADHGDPHAAYAAMGSPIYPTREQVSQLRAAAQNNGLEIRDFRGSDLQLTIPAKGLVVLQLR